MPTFTNYNNYIKAKANSAICCVTTGNCVGGGTSGGTSGTGTADFSKLTAADKNINLNYSPGPEPAGAIAVQIGLKPDLYAQTLTLSNDTLIFQDASDNQLTLGYKTINESYRLHFPQNAPSSLDHTDTSYAIFVNQHGELSWGEFVTRIINLGDFSLNAGSNININFDISYDISRIIINLDNDISLSTIDISKSLTLSDASLVFKKDDKTITLTAPDSIDESYNLILPNTKTDKSGNFLKVDNSGQLYFSNLLDLSLDKLSNLDLSYTGTEYLLKLSQDISITSLDISSAITFKSSTTDKSITLKAPKTLDASYTLTFPETLGTISGGFLQSTLSGDLYFSHAWLNTISGDHNIDIDISKTALTPYTKISLNPDISVSTIDVSSSINLIDSSLVFYTKDSSAITIVAPHGVSNEYTLTLPRDLSGGGYLKADSSGHLKFVDQQITSTNTGLKSTLNKFYDPTKIINYNSSTIEEQVIININRQLLKEGLPIIYYLPLMTFNSDRESTIDQSFSYYDYDTKEYQLIKSSINYINERNLLHAINYNCKYLLNFASVQNILTNYIDSINGFLEIPFINIMSNDFYLKILNIATIANNYSHDTNQNDDNFYNNNKNLIVFINHLKKFKNIYESSFNEIACILPSNLNPPYYFDTSASSSIKIKYDNSWNKQSQPSLDGSYNPLLIFGDIEYEQNFVAIKNALENKNIHTNNDNRKNIIFYFYSQNVGPKENYEFDFLFADTSYNYTDLDICATPVLMWNQGTYTSSNHAFSIKNITLGSKTISDASCALFVNPNLIHEWNHKTQITDLINFHNSQNPKGFDIYNAYNNIIDDDNHDDLRLYFLVEHNNNTYKVLRGTSDTSGWVYEGNDDGNHGIHIRNLTEFNNTDKNGTFTINIPNLADHSIFNETKESIGSKDYNLNTFIHDNSNTCFYDYGNIMFALDASLSTDLSLTNTLDKILIPPINDLNNIYDLMNDKEVYINYDTSINLETNTYKNIDFSFDRASSQSLDNGQIYNELLDELTADPKYLKDASFSNSLEFIDCASSNLITISFDKLEKDLSNNTDSSNILIVCPLYQQNYLLNALDEDMGNFTNIKFEVDNQFSKSLYRYYPLIQYFNTLSKKHSDICYNFTYIVSTNQTNTVNDLVYSANSGTYLEKKNLDEESTTYDLIFKNNLFVNRTNSKIITTYYDKLNKVYNSDKDYSFNNIISIAPQNINSYLQPSNSNLIEKILIHNYNSIENPNSSLLDDLGNTSILTNYNSIETIINIYMLHILYESSQEISNNLIKVIKQKQDENKNFKLYEFYKKMNSNQPSYTIIDNSNIKLIGEIINGEIKLTENGLTKLLQDLNFSFFELTGEDFTDASGYTKINTNPNIGNFRLTMPLIHFNDNSNNDNFTKFNSSKTNSVPLQYITLVNSFQNKSNIIIYDLSNLDPNNSHNLSGQSRNNILKKWHKIYPDYFQYLTL